MILKIKARGFYAFLILDSLDAFLYLCFSVTEHGRLARGRVFLPWAVFQLVALLVGRLVRRWPGAAFPYNENY